MTLFFFCFVLFLEINIYMLRQLATLLKFSFSIEACYVSYRCFSFSPWYVFLSCYFYFYSFSSFIFLFTCETIGEPSFSVISNDRYCLNHCITSVMPYSEEIKWQYLLITKFSTLSGLDISFHKAITELGWNYGHIP